MQVESVAADGSSAQVLIAGTGFVEGGNSRVPLRLATPCSMRAPPPARTSSVASDPVLGFVPNGYVRVTVPLSDGVFGAISIKTAGGVSASYSVSLD